MTNVLQSFNIDEPNNFLVIIIIKSNKILRFFTDISICHQVTIAFVKME